LPQNGKRMQKITEKRSLGIKDNVHLPKHLTPKDDDCIILDIVWDAIYNKKLPFNSHK
jgi:hypothetical protein